MDNPAGDVQLALERQDKLAAKTLQNLDQCEKEYKSILKESDNDVLTIAERLNILSKLKDIAKIRSDILIAGMAVQQRKAGVTSNGTAASQGLARATVAFPPRTQILPKIQSPKLDLPDEP